MLMRSKSSYLRTCLTRLGGLAAATYVRGWMSTLDMQMRYTDPSVDPVNPCFRGPIVAVFWHEYLLTPFATRGHSNTAILTSRHRDADWVFESARHLGFQAVRGSTNRGGRGALLEILRTNNTRNLGISPDGPRGPRRTLAPGPIYLAAKLGRPIVALGVGYDRPWRMNTWDRFAVPRPGSRARIVWGPRIDVPREIDRGELERIRQEVEHQLGLATSEAETWAASGQFIASQLPMRRQPVAYRTLTRSATRLPRPPVRWPTPADCQP